MKAFSAELAASVAAATLAGQRIRAVWELTQMSIGSGVAAAAAEAESEKASADEASATAGSASGGQTGAVGAAGGTAAKSNHADLQTATDRECEEVVVALLKKSFPDHCIIGEESTAASGATVAAQLTDAPTFVIDPIDGTTNFVHTVLSCSVLVAFMVDKQVRSAVVLDPIAGEMFYAEKGHGAWMQKLDANNDLRAAADMAPVRLRTTAQADPKHCMVATDVGYKREPEDVDSFLRVQRALLVDLQVRGLRIIGGCGLGLAYVASGRLDVYVEHESPYIWDFAGASLLVTEAGGAVRSPDGSGGPLDFTKRSILGVASEALIQSFTNLDL